MCCTIQPFSIARRGLGTLTAKPNAMSMAGVSLLEESVPAIMRDQQACAREIQPRRC